VLELTIEIIRRSTSSGHWKQIEPAALLISAVETKKNKRKFIQIDSSLSFPFLFNYSGLPTISGPVDPCSVPAGTSMFSSSVRPSSSASPLSSETCACLRACLLLVLGPPGLGSENKIKF